MQRYGGFRPARLAQSDVAVHRVGGIWAEPLISSLSRLLNEALVHE